MAANKRHVKRQRIRHPAWAMPTPEQRIDCFVTDVSENGARIQVNDAENVPDCFALLLSNNGAPRRFCRAIWRKPHEIGVRFAQTFAEAMSLTVKSNDKGATAPLESKKPAGAA